MVGMCVTSDISTSAQASHAPVWLHTLCSERPLSFSYPTTVHIDVDAMYDNYHNHLIPNDA